MIVYVAIVGHQNNLKYLQSFMEAEDTLKLHHIVHCSLDVVDERVNNPKRSGPTLNETFLGMYGYLTITKVKFLMVWTKVKFLMVTTDLDVNYADVRNEATIGAPAHKNINGLDMIPLKSILSLARVVIASP
ncbi:Trafficking protein particle complex subunit [Musa troglodytarum]|uniref:Trafficking protein particle complex subunit n=1 Tax=Musa troglodytarum TaxID=320322 RepID=A0A9E7JTV2_9LILI|nr:Trafficking protein particle complex subunit [Musa troglodytarum]